MEPRGEPPLPTPPPSAHRSGDRVAVHFHHRPAFAKGEGSTLQQIAHSMGLGEEAAMDALLRAAAEGFVETNITHWRALSRDASLG